MPYANNITQLVEKAAKEFLSTRGLTLVMNGYTGLCSDDIALPYYVCVCKSATCEELYDGNWSADLRIGVISSADDTSLDDHRERAGEVFSHFMTATIADDLSTAISDFTAFAVYPRSQSWDIVDNTDWTSEFALTVKCCGSTIA